MNWRALMVATVLTVTGCSEGGLEDRVTDLENRLTQLEVAEDTSGESAAEAEEVPREPAPKTLEPAAPAPALPEIVDVTARATERNQSWWRYGWRLSVANRTGEPMTFDATIQFVDEGGFVIDDDRARGLRLGPREERTFTDADLIDASVAADVAGVKAILTE